MENETELRGESSFPDHYMWLDMSLKRGVRLPIWKSPCTTGGMRRFLRKVNLPVEEYLDSTNEKNLRVFHENNPSWPLRAWCGLILEYLEQKEQPAVDFTVIKRKRGRPRKNESGT